MNPVRNLFLRDDITIEVDIDYRHNVYLSAHKKFYEIFYAEDF